PLGCHERRRNDPLRSRRPGRALDRTGSASFEGRGSLTARSAPQRFCGPPVGAVGHQGESGMRIGIIGASGNIGSRILAEAVARGHDLVAYTRSGAATKGTPWRDLDIFDQEALRTVA